MRRFISGLLAAAFLLVLVPNGWGVEKKLKKIDTKVAPAISQKTAQNPVAVQQPRKSGAARKASRQKTDDFVDQNKNGIDDRKENLKKKPAERSTAAAKQKADSSKSDKKK
ncbi:MAG: hypothetical protein KKA42_15100 [candidate division Zixibacteria bacterium]|nr:hypothetical protein [candidate division Zixibacteria bacterium]